LFKYYPNDNLAAENIIERVISRLSHSNPSIVISSVKIIIKMINYI